MGAFRVIVSRRCLSMYLRTCVIFIVVILILQYNKVYRKNFFKKRSKTLLVLSTTIKESPLKIQMNSNTLYLWPLLGSNVQPVLYVERDDPCCENVDSRWLKHDIPEKGGGDLPILRSMVLHSMTLVDSDFYGFANGDILFGYNLIVTLQAIKKYLPSFQKVLIVGRRTNARISEEDYFLTIDEVEEFSHRRGKLFNAAAEDYFITSKIGLDWRDIPEFVIGRRGFDNWIVAYALHNNITVIDVTNTVTALHQTGMDGNYAGHRHEDRNLNMRISGAFNFRKGYLFCVVYETVFDMYGDVWIRKRTPDSPYC